jgi:hypothetical protein
MAFGIKTSRSSAPRVAAMVEIPQAVEVKLYRTSVSLEYRTSMQFTRPVNIPLIPNRGMRPLRTRQSHVIVMPSLLQLHASQYFQ